MATIWVMIGWFVGLWFGDVLGWEWRIWAAAGAPVLSWSIWLFGRGRLTFKPLLLLAFCLGGLRLAWSSPVFAESHVRQVVRSAIGAQEEVVLTGVVEQEPDIRDDQISLIVAADALSWESGQTAAVEGLVLVAVPRWAQVNYGDRISVRGKLKQPEARAGEFDYPGYLARQNIFVLMPAAELTSAEPGYGIGWLSTMLHGKQRAQAVIDQILPAPESGLLSGILLGTQHALSEQVAADFQATGITHIVVISGFNISIVAAIFLRVLTPLTGRRGAAAGSILAIILYTILVGADAAVIRAAIMGSLFVISERLLGRKTFAVASLLLAAMIMTAWRPLMLWDVGFQLSFTATLSLMIYADQLTVWVRDRLQRHFNRRTTAQIVGLVNEAVLVTIAAQILTLPLLMYIFQQLSLISLLANALILPAQAGVMLWGGLATVLGLVDPLLGQAVGQVAYLFLWYTIRVSRVLAGVPWAIVTVPFPLWLLMFVYGALAAWTWFKRLEPEAQLAVRYQIKSYLSAGILFSACLIVLGWSGRWWITRPDGDLHLIVTDSESGSLIWLHTPSGRQLAIIEDPRPTAVTQFLGEHQPLLNRRLDVLIGLSTESTAYQAWPAVLERYQVDTLLLPTGLKMNLEEPLWEKIEQLPQDKEINIEWLNAVDQLKIDDGVSIYPIFFSSSGHSEVEEGVGVVYGKLALQLDFSAPDQPISAKREDNFQENLKINFSLQETPYPLTADHWSYLSVRSDGEHAWLSGVPFAQNPGD